MYIGILFDEIPTLEHTSGKTLERERGKKKLANKAIHTISRMN